MSDSPPGPPPSPNDAEDLVAIPRIAEELGLTPRVLRYWEEQGLISPSREHGKLRYSPRDVGIARLTKRLLDSGVSVDGVRMLKELAEREIRRAASAGDSDALAEIALRILYQRKAFQEVAGMKEDHFPEGHPHPAGLAGHRAPGPKQAGPRHDRP